MLVRAVAAAAIALGACAGPAAAAPLAAPPAVQWALGPLKAATAWQQSTGAGTLVAVLDTGVSLQRRELSGRIWTNPGEIPGNGVDDDHDGVVDDVHGADFANGDGDPSDDNGHGTHVAGIIAAHGAVRGLAPGATILPVKVLGTDNSGNAHWLSQGIAYAIARGARILNVSVNGDQPSAELESAIRAAQAAGAVIVASAGNDGRDLRAHPSYPVSFPERAVLGVGASTLGGARASFSNYGPGVDLTAPGDDIMSLGFPGFAWRSGTSMAAAYVSATLALEAAAAPGLPVQVLGTVLLRSARAGRAVDAGAAVRALAGRPKARHANARRTKHAHARHHAARARA